MRDARRTAVWFVALLAIVFAGDRLLALLCDEALLRSQFRFSRLYRGGNEAGIVIMGDSRGVHSFYAPELERLTGQHVLNLSYNSMSSRIAEALLSDYVERNPAPRLVIIEVTHLAVASDLATELKTYTHHSARLRALYAESHPQAARLGGVFRLHAYDSEFFLRALAYLRRSDQDWINHATIGPELLTAAATSRQLSFRPESLDALERTVRMLRARGIVVRLVIAPYQAADITNLAEFTSSVSSRVGLPVLNYAAAGGAPENFADRVHLNQRGAEELAKMLARDGVLDGRFVRSVGAAAGPGPRG
jgi:hypothetical protein